MSDRDAQGLVMVLLAVSAIAHAAPSDADAAVCRNGLFTSSPSAFSLAKVVVPRLYLLNDSDGCPGKGEAACRQRSYVVKGDVVVLAQHRVGWCNHSPQHWRLD